MKTFSALLAICEHRSTMDSHHKGSVTCSFSLVVSLNKLLGKQLSCQLFETPWRSSDVSVIISYGPKSVSWESVIQCWVTSKPVYSLHKWSVMQEALPMYGLIINCLKDVQRVIFGNIIPFFALFLCQNSALFGQVPLYSLFLWRSLDFFHHHGNLIYWCAGMCSVLIITWITHRI